MLEEIFLLHAGARRSRSEPDEMVQEKADSRLVFEDHQATSNLPTQGYQRTFNPNANMQSIGTDRGIPNRYNRRRS